MMKKTFVFALFILTITLYGQSQTQPDWVEMMQDPFANFYQTQEAFENYWEERQVEKGKGFKQFKRWEVFMEPRVYPTGEKPSPDVLFNAQQYVNKTFTDINGTWKPLGPFNGNAIDGVGRVNRLSFHPTNAQIIYACTAAGGLWKTVDGGNNWTTNTDLLTNLGCSDLIIDPFNTDIMYLATGDRDGGDTYSYGILKSIDGGATWNPTGLSFAQSQAVRVSDLYMHPQNSNIIIASTRSGIYRTTDAGVNWLLVQNGIFNEVVQKPDNPNVLFTSTITGSARIYRSTNNGFSWNLLSDPNLPTSGARRIEIGVTPDDSNYVYALMGATNNGFEGIYRSVDGGDTWVQRANSPNLMGWSTTGSDLEGQAWYDLAIAIDPTDKERVYTGGVNVWTSSDGGTNWSLETHWYGGGGAPFIHADIHDLEYSPTGQLWAGNDGGIYSKDEIGTSWSEHNDGINITQYYQIGAAENDTTKIIAGAQDNGTHLFENPAWDKVRGGDGMDCAISSLNSNVMYSSVYYGDFRKSTNGGNDFNASFNLPPAGTGNWVTPFALDPLHPDTMYAGFDRVWRSYDGGNSFTAVSPSNLTGSVDIDVLTVAPKHTNVVYISVSNTLWESEDWGATWVSRTVLGNAVITDIAVHPSNPKRVVITTSGYNSGQKVYESFNGGFSWTNLSGSLPNIPANCAVYVNDNSEGLYVGTDAGVFYRDKNSSDWIDFNSDLPNVIVNELEINYINKKIRAGTYGRGLWESKLYGLDFEPVADIEVANTICLGDTVLLKDASSYNPTAWSWSVIPNTGFTYVNGTSANSQNPELVFTQIGVFNIALTVSNSEGMDSVLKISAINSGGFPLPYAQDFETLVDFETWESPISSFGKVFTNTTVSGNGGILAPSVTFRNTSNIGDAVELISPKLNFAGTDSVWMDFEYAYTSASSNNGDSLKVYVADACSDNWVLVAKYGENGTNNFVTTSPDAGNFIPSSAANWCGNTGYGQCKTIDLSAFSGSASVKVKLVAVSGGGNAIYLDNININGRASVAPSVNFSALQTVCALRPLSFTNQTLGAPTTYEWTFTGGSPAVSNQRNPSVTYAAPGIYEVKLKASNSIGVDSLVKTSYISVEAASLVSATISTNNSNTRCVGDTFSVTATAVNEGVTPVYDWYVNDDKIASTNSGQYDYTDLTNGDTLYCVLTSSEDCAFPQNAFSDTIVASYYIQSTLSITSASQSCSDVNALSLTATPAGGTFSGDNVSNNIFNPSSAEPGNHVVTYTYTDVNGCVTTMDQVILVSAPASIIFTMQDYCEDQGPILLNTGYPAGGNYSGEGVFSNYLFTDSVSPGTYNITYSFATQGCVESSETLIYNILQKPSEPTITLLNDTLFTTDIAGFTYQWYENGTAISGATQNYVVPTSNVDHFVIVTNSSGCSNQSDELSPTIGLVENSSVQSFELYPNPAKNVLNLKMYLYEAKEVEIKITNLAGKLVYNASLETSFEVSEILDLGKFTTGMYILNISLSDGERLTRKFSKL